MLLLASSFAYQSWRQYTKDYPNYPACLGSCHVLHLLEWIAIIFALLSWCRDANEAAFSVWDLNWLHSGWAFIWRARIKVRNAWFWCNAILHSWTTLQAFGRTSPFQWEASSWQSDSVVIQQKENLQWCDSMIASILPNHNESHTHVALSGTSGWSTLQSDIILVWKENAQTGRALLNHPKNLKKYLIMFHFQSLSWTTDWIWHISLWHIGCLAKALLCSATGLYSLQPMVLISINPCHLSQPLHLTFQHPHVLSMFFSNNPWYLIFGRGESTKVLFSRKHKLASVKDTTIASQDKPSTYEPCSLLQSH